MDKLNELLIRFPKASALIPCAVILVTYAVTAGLSAMLQALAVTCLIMAVLIFVAAVKAGKDLGGDDDLFGPGGPRPA